MSNSLLDAALTYGERGLAVLPNHDVTAGYCSCVDGRKCASAGKHPRIMDPYGRSTTDPDAIREFWGMFPNANIGLDCGKAGVVVIDIDPRHGGDETWSALVAKHDLSTETRQTITGGGGRQLFYKAPTGIKIKNQAGVLGPGLDNRAAGGQVILPPSLHPSGKRYTWDQRYADLLPLPRALLELLSRRPRPQTAGHQQLNNGNGHSGYAQAELAGSVAALSRAPEGTRNNALNATAFALGQLVGGGVLERPEVEERLTDAAREAGLDETEIAPTLASGIGAGEQEPRTASIGYLTTDTANAERLASRYDGRLRHVGPWGWLIWDGRRWRLDDTGEIYRYAKDTARSIYAEAAEASDDATAEKLASWARTSLNLPKLQAMIKAAESEELIASRAEDFDAWPWLMNCGNGTIDLRSGELRHPERSDCLTHLAPLPYDPEAECLLWEQFLNRIFDRNGQLIDFLQRAVGYSLTGDTSEQCLFVLYGTGANGKSTMVETLRALLGDYGQQAEFSSFMARRDEGPRNDVARMAGARLVAAVESGEGRRLNEGLIKSLTGGDTVTARLLYREHFEFKPQFKLWLATNHKPAIRGTDDAIWRRVRLIPFGVTIPPAEQDHGLADKLRGELPGILAWAVRGCLAWQQQGLGAPPEVSEATDAYRAEQDDLATFLDECCLLKADAQVNSSALHKAYTVWGGEDGARQFGLHLKERGFIADRGAHGARIWRGVGLLADSGDA